MNAELPTPSLERAGVWALATANAISLIGNTLTWLAVPWFVLTTTGSASRTGLASAMFAAAGIISGLTIGNLIDHVGFRRMSILSDALSGVTVLLIPTLHLLGWLNYWQLLALVFLGAYFDTPGRSARAALVPALAGMSRMPLERANAILRVAGITGDAILGPLIAGVLIAVIGEINLLFIDAATFSVSILIMALVIRVPRAAVSGSGAESGDSPGQRQRGLDVFLAGFRFALQDRVMRVLLPTAALYSGTLSAYFGVVLPVYVEAQFDQPAYLGVLIAVLGGGMLLGTLAYGAVGHRYSRYATILWASAASAVALWCFTIPTYFPSDVLAMFAFGVAGGPFNPLLRTLIQTRTPGHLLGRALNAIFTLAAVAAPLGVLIAGLAIDAFGLRAVQFAAALLISLVPLWFVFAPGRAPPRQRSRSSRRSPPTR